MKFKPLKTSLLWEGYLTEVGHLTLVKQALSKSLVYYEFLLQMSLVGQINLEIIQSGSSWGHKKLGIILLIGRRPVAYLTQNFMDFSTNKGNSSVACSTLPTFPVKSSQRSPSGSGSPPGFTDGSNFWHSGMERPRNRIPWKSRWPQFASEIYKREPYDFHPQWQNFWESELHR